MPMTDNAVTVDAEDIDDETVERTDALGADLDSITETLANASPTPNHAAINAQKEQNEEAKAQYADLRDSKGNRFDPEQHVTNDSGEPVLTKTGKLRMRPGRKAGQKSESSSKGHIGGQANTKNENGMTAQEVAHARATGTAAASALITAGVVLGGDEWQPRVDSKEGVNEHESLSFAFGDYFEAKGVTDIPPGVALTIAIVGYAAPRFVMPKTQSRVTRFKLWAATKWNNRKAKKVEKKDGAQSNTGNDGKRENDASEASSQ